MSEFVLWKSEEINSDLAQRWTPISLIPLKFRYSTSLWVLGPICLFVWKQWFFSPVWRINTAENGHRKHIFLKSLQSRYFGKHRFCSTRWDGWKRKFLQTSTLWCCIACVKDMVYAIRGPAATQYKAWYCIHNNLVPRALFPGLGGGAGKGHFRVDGQKRFKNGTCGGELFF